MFAFCSVRRRRRRVACSRFCIGAIGARAVPLMGRGFCDDDEDADNDRHMNDAEVEDHFLSRHGVSPIRGAMTCLGFDTDVLPTPGGGSAFRDLAAQALVLPLAPNGDGACNDGSDLGVPEGLASRMDAHDNSGAGSDARSLLALRICPSFDDDDFPLGATSDPGAAEDDGSGATFARGAAPSMRGSVLGSCAFVGAVLGDGASPPLGRSSYDAARASRGSVDDDYDNPSCDHTASCFNSECGDEDVMSFSDDASSAAGSAPISCFDGEPC